MQDLCYTYAGLVESTLDPLKLGRLKVRVPHVFGASTTGAGYIGTNDLPWALPAGLPAGGQANSGGFSQLPENGDKVWVRFLDGEPEKPIWEWGMQSTDDRDKLLLHRYDTGSPVGPPNRAFWTRYGHGIEINAGSVIVTTSQGYRMVITDASSAQAADGNIEITTPQGNSFKLDDLDNTGRTVILEDYYFIISSGMIGTSDSFKWTTDTDDFTVDSGGGINLTSIDDIVFQGASDINFDSLANTKLTTSDTFTLGFTNLLLGLTATEPVVLGNQLSLWIASLLLYLSTHTHTSATPGSPTSPPLQPPATILPLAADLLSKTVTVQN